jgi:DNA-binding MarR family transcriptional regulator
MEMGLDEKRMAVWQAFLQTYTTVIPALECEMQAAEGLPLTWYNVLTHLNRDPSGGVRLQDLAEAVVLSQSGLTRLLDRMFRAGLIERKPCPHDRRGAYAVLTPKGKAALDQATPTHILGIEQHFMQHLDDEDVQALNRLLLKILEAEKK